MFLSVMFLSAGQHHPRSNRLPVLHQGPGYGGTTSVSSSGRASVGTGTVTATRYGYQDRKLPGGTFEGLERILGG